MNITNKLFINTIIYGISGSFVALIPLLLLPFMTRNLSQSDYGSALFFSAILTMILPFIGFGSANAISVRFFQLSRDKFNSYLWSCMSIICLSSLFILLFFFIGRSYVSNFLAIPFIWFFIAAITACFWGISQACCILFIAKKDAYKYLLINLVISFTTILFSIISIKFLSLSWKGFAWALFLGHLFAASLSLLLVYKDTKFSVINRDYINDSIRFGLPILFHSVSMSLISYFDRVIITNNLGLEELARYSVAFQIALILNFSAQAFNKAFVPWLYKNLKSGSYQAKVKIVKGTYFIFSAIAIFTILFCFILKFLILYIAGEQYIDVYHIAIIIAVAGAFNAAYLMVVNYIFYAGKTFMLGIISVSVATIFIALSLFMVPIFGLEGASFSFLIANFILFILVWILAQKSFSMPWFSRSIFN
tara:strand:- start:2449 stop:3711 length:1263 start_codon:yes stop_codon:yes gene_type:complete